MNWLTWDQAAWLAAFGGAVALSVRWYESRRNPVPKQLGWVRPAGTELAIIAGLYSIWRLARQLPFTHEAGAMERGLDIYRFERWTRLPSELAAQHLVERHEWLGPPVSYYYASLHVPALLTFLVWLFIRHRDRFAHWRNGLAVLTAGCLVIRFVRVAPPRFFPELGYVDLAARYGPDVYGPIGTGLSDQFAAMPSIHVGWAAVVSFGAFAVTTSRWRWLVLMHVFVTAFVVSATAQHWWLDGVVAVALLAFGLNADRFIRRWWVRRSATRRTASSQLPELSSEPASASATVSVLGSTAATQTRPRTPTTQSSSP